MSSSTIVYSKLMTYNVEPSVFSGDSNKGTARISFYLDDQLIHDQFIDATKTMFDRKTILTHTGEIAGYKVSGSITLPSGAPPIVQFKYNRNQIEQANRIAFEKLNASTNLS